MSTPITQAPTQAQLTLERARERLLALQDQAGWWKGELQTNVTMDAEDILLREFLGIRERTGERALGRVDPLAAAQRRHLVEFPRWPRGPIDHDRGLLGAEAGW